MESERPKIRVVSAEILRNGRYLITQRSAKAVLPLLWEFPGGRVRDGESDAQALSRCLRDRIGVAPMIEKKQLEITHDYGLYSVTLIVYRCRLDTHEPWAANVAAFAWVAPEEFSDYPFPGADQRTVDLLLKEG